MTPERLAEIRKRASRCGESTAARDRAELLAEVEWLQEQLDVEEMDAEYCARVAYERKQREEARANTGKLAKSCFRVAQECVETGYTSGRIAERLRQEGVAVTQSDLYPVALAFANLCEANRDYERTLRRDKGCAQREALLCGKHEEAWLSKEVEGCGWCEVEADKTALRAVLDWVKDDRAEVTWLAGMLLRQVPWLFTDTPPEQKPTDP